MAVSNISRNAVPLYPSGKPLAQPTQTPSRETFGPAVEISVSTKALDTFRHSNAVDSQSSGNIAEKLDGLFNRVSNLLVAAGGRSLNGTQANDSNDLNPIQGFSKNSVKELGDIFDEINTLFKSALSTAPDTSRKNQLRNLGAVLDEIDSLLSASKNQTLTAGDIERFDTLFKAIDTLFKSTFQRV